MIAVNLITGFLGVGKTTLIRRLLTQHRADQSWGVLVNEFGEIGVDGELLKQPDVALQEVAGGCLCCVSAAGFSVGLNRLIRQAKPQRILIEPSGLGHPARVLETLRSPVYQHVLDVQATIGVLDARHLSSARHLEHPVFQDQVHLADVLIANKSDLYQEQDHQALLDFMARQQPAKIALALVEQGRMDPQLLHLTAPQRQASFPEAHAFLLAQESAQQAPNIEDWLCLGGTANGYHHLGWRIENAHRFAFDRLLSWLDGLPYQRIKGILHTDQGWLAYNRSGDDSARSEPQSVQTASRLQIIHSASIDQKSLDSQLRQLVSV